MSISSFPPILPTPDPKSAFGEPIGSSNEPVIQIDFTHIVPVEGAIVEELGGTAARNAGEGTMEVSSGTTVGGNAVFRTQRALVYRAGQGNMARWSCMFDTGGVGSIQLSGILSTSDGFAFTYQDADFGILYRHGGDSEVQKLTLTTPAGGAENATVTLNGTGYTVALTGLGTVEGDASEIALSLTSQIPTVIFCQVGDTVVYTSRLSQVEAGFAYSSASSVGSWAQTTAGVPPVNDFIAQADWNMDTRPDLIPQNFNVYQVQYQFLGSGAIEFFIEDSGTGEFVIVHRIKFANTSTTPSLRNPNLYLAIFSGNTTGTTSKTVATVSMAAFRQGRAVTTGRANSDGNSASVGTTLTNIVTFMVRGEIGGRIFRGETLFSAVALSTDSGKGAVFQFIVGATVAGGTNFSYHDEDSSLMLVDTSGGAVSGGRLVSTARLGAASGETFLLERSNEVLIAGQTITVAAAVTSGASADCGAAITWFEGV